MDLCSGVGGLDDALEAVAGRKPILALDFDGTLAPIVDRPEDAGVPQSTARSLAGLSRECQVAIVTGRSVDDVRKRLGFRPWRIIGSHGGECPFHPERSAELARALDGFRRALSVRGPVLESLGVVVEDKEQSISLHYRCAKHRVRAIGAIKDCVELGRNAGIRVVGGKCVVNFVAASAPDKGQAVKALLDESGAGSVVYAGDDLNDEPVFACAPSDWVTIKVGRASGTRARFVVVDTFELAFYLERFLRLLIRRGDGTVRA